MDDRIGGGLEHLGVGGGSLSGGRDVGARPLDLGRRSDPAEHVEHRPRRRQRVVEGAEDDRALRFGAQHERRGVQRQRARHPDDRETEAGERNRAADRIGRGERAARGRRSRRENARPSRSAATSPPISRPRATRYAGVGGRGAIREHERRDASTDRGSQREAAQAEAGDEEAAVIADRHEHQQQHDDRPVDDGHPDHDPGSVPASSL